MMGIEPLGVEIAGITFGVHLPFEAWRAALAARYAAFLTAAPPAWQVRLAHDPALAVTDAPWVRHDGPVTTFRLSDQAGRIDLAACLAEISVGAEARAATALDRTLAYICLQALPRRGDALLLHAVGIVLDGKGYVFAGASGAGKTTVARLAAGRGEVLTDENVILELGTGAPALCSTPFWGHSTPPELIDRVNRRVPLAALYLLAHAPKNELSPLTAGQAVMALLSTEKVATERPESAAAWLAVAEQLVQKIPVYRLGFRPTAALWQFLEQARQ